MQIWLDPAFVDRLRALSEPGEGYSNVILRLTKPTKEGIPRSIMIWPRRWGFRRPRGAGELRGLSAVTAGPRQRTAFFEGRGIASRSLDSLGVGAPDALRQPSENTHEVTELSEWLCLQMDVTPRPLDDKNTSHLARKVA